jgi:hypothetical protein
LTEALVELGDALSAHLECAAEVLDELDRCLTIDECDATTVARCDGDAQRQLAACPPLSPTAKQRFDDCRP